MLAQSVRARRGVGRRRHHRRCRPCRAVGYPDAPAPVERMSRPGSSRNGRPTARLLPSHHRHGHRPVPTTGASSAARGPCRRHCWLRPSRRARGHRSRCKFVSAASRTPLLSSLTGVTASDRGNRRARRRQRPARRCDRGRRRRCSPAARMHCRARGRGPSYPDGSSSGGSVHSDERGAGAEAADGGCDYLLFGTVFASESKPAGHPVAGLDALAQRLRRGPAAGPGDRRHHSGARARRRAGRRRRRGWR